MKKNIVFLLFKVFFVFSQAPNIEWQNRFGGSNFDVAYSSKLLNNNGFIIGGRSASNISVDKSQNAMGNQDYWIIKTDNNGNKILDKTIGGGSLNIEHDLFNTLNITTDGGYILCGSSNSPISGDKTIDSFNQSDDIWIVKTDSNGIIVWQKVLGGDNVENCYSMIPTNDGGYLIGGLSNSPVSGNKNEGCRGLNNFYDFWVIKISSIGDIEWQKTIGGDGIDYISNVIQTTDNGYLIGGNSNSNVSFEKSENSKGFKDYWIVKLDNLGNITWQKTYGGSSTDDLHALFQTNDGGYFLGGSSSSPISGDKTVSSFGSDDYWVIKTDSVGTIEWQNVYGGTESDTLFSAIQNSDNNFVLTGTSLSGASGNKTELSRGSYDSWTLKINNFGNILWQKTLGGSGQDGFNYILQTIDGGYFLSGGTDSPISYDIINPFRGSSDYWLVKLSPENLSTNNFANAAINIYPNPTTGIININFGQVLDQATLTLTNVLGQVVSSKTVGNLVNTIFEINEPNGIYFLEIVSQNNEKKVFKIIKN
jgi:hypothetical protein